MIYDRKMSSNDLVPQKEDLDNISRIPFLFSEGVNDPTKISMFFRQHYRMGCFYLKSCEILGWIKNNKLTTLGHMLNNANISKRKIIIVNSVINTEIFILLEYYLGDKWYLNPEKEIIYKILTNIGFKYSTAVRRGNCIYSWSKYVFQNKEFIICREDFNKSLQSHQLPTKINDIKKEYKKLNKTKKSSELFDILSDI